MDEENLKEIIKSQGDMIVKLIQAGKAQNDKQLILFKYLNCFLSDYASSLSELSQVDRSVILDRISLCAESQKDDHQSFLKIVK